MFDFHERWHISHSLLVGCQNIDDISRKPDLHLQETDVAPRGIELEDPLQLVGHEPCDSGL